MYGAAINPASVVCAAGYSQVAGVGKCVPCFNDAVRDASGNTGFLGNHATTTSVTTFGMKTCTIGASNAITAGSFTC